MNLKEFREKLKKHDWYYEMSDDHRIYKAGYESEMELKRLYYGKKTYQKAYDTMSNKKFPKKK